METVKSEKVSWAHHTIYTDIVIDASPDVVWSVREQTNSQTGTS